MPNYDIGLVRTFTTVYETRSVTHAAEQLFVSQPSVSYALKRLRKIFGNELFIRSGQEMVPTAAAERIYPRLRGSLETIDEIMQGEENFAASTSSRTFRLQMTDIGTTVLLPPIIRAASVAAPNVRIEVEQLKFSSAPDDLLEGRIDAFLCTPKIVHPDIRRDVLFRQHYVGICAANHPRIGPKPTLVEFLAERHVSLTGETGHHIVDDTFVEQGHSREIVLSVPNFLVLPLLLQDTELICFAPLVMAQAFVAAGNVRTFELPVQIPITEVSLYSYRRPQQSPAANWFENLVRTTLQKLNKLLT
ncbi:MULTISPECIES: LysR family transcriptional regulator [unclassified Arthrobacter]|uniref:LysR family transcriptional regulator n=1 Tax=unclassified Arthrobacter TaxID=235627 RepID=UPI000CE51276|nr:MULTISPECIES: LysR family transcriptional regulator [unclassified Arthrobacter]